MNEVQAEMALTKLSASKRQVGAIILDIDGAERSQVTGNIGIDPRFPDKWVVSITNQYIIFTLDEVHEIKDDRIYLRLIGQRTGQ